MIEIVDAIQIVMVIVSKRGNKGDYWLNVAIVCCRFAPAYPNSESKIIWIISMNWITSLPLTLRVRAPSNLQYLRTKANELMNLLHNLILSSLIVTSRQTIRLEYAGCSSWSLKLFSLSGITFVYGILFMHHKIIQTMS